MSKSGCPTIKSISNFIDRSKEEGKTIALVTGCFDILHMGHINLFRFAAKKADFLIVGIEHDETIRRAKGSDRPVNNQINRLQLLQELRSVGRVFFNR